MTRLAVRAESLSKSYRIRSPDAPQLRDYLSGFFAAVKRPRTLDVIALRDVSFEVPEGEVFGIVGRNGAGKSTLLKILSRITTPSLGRATLVGHIASLLEVGTGFHPELTGRENVYLNGTLLGMRSADVTRVFDEIADFAGVGAYIDTPIKRYSSGMKLRLAFSVAAHLAANTMIIDEVLAVGDAEFQARCTNAMRSAASHGRTTIFVSHNMTAVENLCHRAMLLEHGEVVAIGPASEIVKLYLERASGQSVIDAEYVAQTAAKANAAVFIARAGISGADGAVPRMGQDLYVTFHVHARQRIDNLQLQLSLSTSSGTLVSLLRSSDFHEQWSIDPGVHRFTMHLTSPRLLPHNMRASLRLVRMKGVEVLDDAPDAITFTVHEADVLGTGARLLPDRGITWFDATFTHDR